MYFPVRCSTTKKKEAERRRNGARAWKALQISTKTQYGGYYVITCIAGVVVDMHGLVHCTERSGSGCEVGLRRLLRRADYISAPLSGQVAK